MTRRWNVRRRRYGRSRKQFAAGTAYAVATAADASASQSTSAATGRRAALPRWRHCAVQTLMLRSRQRHHSAADDCWRSDDDGQVGRHIDGATCSVVAGVRRSRVGLALSSWKTGVTSAATGAAERRQQNNVVVDSWTTVQALQRVVIILSPMYNS